MDSGSDADSAAPNGGEEANKASPRALSPPKPQADQESSDSEEEEEGADGTAHNGQRQANGALVSEDESDGDTDGEGEEDGEDDDGEEEEP